MSKRLTTEEFIDKALLIHGDRYDYSLTEYFKTDTKVDIICKKHGLFKQTPLAHLRGQGCPECNKDTFLTTELFIEKAKAVHGDKYDYSKTIYVDCHTKVEIICPKHGSFFVKPSPHLRGCECKRCEDEKKRSNSEEFIKKAIAIHGDKYDYSKVEYINSSTKVCIICKEHGEFWQRPNTHLSYKGCPTCAGRGQDFDYFIKKAREIHNRNYSYEKVEYVNTITKVEIICPLHGSFWQTPSSHLNGFGCAKCSGMNVKQEKTKEKRGWGNIIG